MALQAQKRLHPRAQLLPIVGFAQEPVRAGINASHTARIVGERGDEHDRQQPRVRPPLSRRHVSKPFRPGIITSISTRSVAAAEAAWSASAPLRPARHEIAVLAQEPREECSRGVVVVDDEDPWRAVPHAS